MSVKLIGCLNTGSGSNFRFTPDEDFARFEEIAFTEGVFKEVTISALQVTEKGAGADMSVDVAVGKCLQELTRSGRTFKTYVQNTATENLVISANVSGSTRIDVIYVKIDVTLNPDTDADNVASLIVNEGTPAAGKPAAPVDGNAYLELGEVEVIHAAVTIPDAKITDSRIQALINGTMLDTDLTTVARKSQNFQMSWEGIVSNIAASGAGSATNFGNFMQFSTGALATDYCNWKSEPFANFLTGAVGSGITVIFNMRTFKDADSDRFVGFADFTEGAQLPGAVTSVINHIGFWQTANTVYVSNADGGTQTKTQVAATSGSGQASYRIEISTTSISFYVNNVLQAPPHTTDIPTFGNVDFLFIGNSNIAAFADDFDISGIYLTGNTVSLI